jgi:hypothetical protein
MERLMANNRAIYYRLRDESYQGMSVDAMLDSISALTLDEEIAWLEMKIEADKKAAEDARRRR